MKKTQIVRLVETLRALKGAEFAGFTDLELAEVIGYRGVNYPWELPGIGAEDIQEMQTPWT